MPANELDMVGRFIEECRLSFAQDPLASLAMPWEIGVFRDIFKSTTDDGLRVEMPPLLGHKRSLDTSHGPECASGTDKRPCYIQAIAFSSRRTRHLDAVSQREVTLGKWLMAISSDLFASQVGQDLVLLDVEDRLEYLYEVMGGKSSATLTKRVGQFTQYLRHCQTMKQPPFPLDKMKLRDYIQSIRLGPGSHSRVSGFVECVTFLIHVLGFDIDQSLLRDPWLKGIQRELQTERPPRRQARPLLCQEIIRLEDMLADRSLTLQDRYACGAILFGIYARARASDLRHISTLTIDPGATIGTGYIEASTYRHKNRRLGNAAGLPLLLIAPMKGLGPRSWGMDFVEVAAKTGLSLEKSEELEAPLLPAPTANGVWSDRSVTSTELAAWLCKLLGLPEAVGKPTSHSIKTTVLSMVVKWGGNPDNLLVLGHHEPRQRGLGMVHVYGRDIQAAPLREMERCLCDIREGRFFPDLTRSGMVPAKGGDTPYEPVQPLPRATERSPDPPVAPSEAAPSNSPASCGSSSDSSSDTSSDDVAVLCRGQVDPPPCCSVYRHRRTKTLHLLPLGGTAFVCGRKLSDDHAQFEGPILSSAQKCAQCESGRPLRTIAGLVDALDGAAARRRVG